VAGDWLKVDIALPDKPEVWQIAEALNLDPDTVVGKLIRVWGWFDQHTENGNAPSVTKKLIDREVGVTGFIDALCAVHWMTDKNGALQVVNFDRHHSKSAKNRALTNVRVKRKRNADAVSKSLPEKRREESITTDVVIETPDWIDPDTWNQFQQHRKEIKAPLKPTATKALIAKLDKHRLKGADPNEALRESVANGWRGVFPEKLLEAANGKTQHRTGQAALSKFEARERRNQDALERARRGEGITAPGSYDPALASHG